MYSPRGPRRAGAARSAAAASPAAGREKPLERVADLGAHPGRRDEEDDGVDEELGVHDHVADEDGELGQEPTPVDIQA